MALFGLELGASLSTAIAVAILAVLWEYSAMEEVDWAEIMAGIMVFVTAAGLNIAVGPDGIALMLPSAQQLSQAVPVLNVVGALLLIVGGLRNAVQTVKAR